MAFIKIQNTNARWKALEARLDEEKAFDQECIKRLQEIVADPWVKANTTIKFNVDWLHRYAQLNLQVEDIIYEDLVEHILGPYHRRYDTLWELLLDGQPEDPVFVLKPKWSWTRRDNFNITIRAKEGKFTSCKFSTREIKNPHFYIPDPTIQQLEMVCE